MDPIMRMFMEASIEATMDAGVNPTELEGSKTGVFVSVCWSDVENKILTAITEKQKFGITGYLWAFIPHRVSYYLKLKGPSCVIDSACSSSLTALETAFKTIINGQCDGALVGGVNLLMHPSISAQFLRMGVLSREGTCRLFDQNANGYVRAEAIVCVFLQKAKNSRRVYGKIISVKTNNDGFKEQGITFPSKEMQQKLITEIYMDGGIHPSDLSYFEAHGTGTQVGDPQEVAAVDCAIAIKRQKPLLIGSVKSISGHGEPCSGLCSLIKVLIAMETGEIPPNMNFTQIRSGIDGLEQGRIKVVTDLTQLEDDRVIIGVNNFGFGGSNCHLLLRRFDKKRNDKRMDDIPRLICFSGRTEEAVWTIINDINKRPIDYEYVGLYHQIFKNNINAHLYRGNTVISKDGAVKSSTKRLPDNRFFYIIQNFIQTNITCTPEEYDYHNDINILSIMVQIVIADILQVLEIKINKAFGNSLICAYLKGKLSMDEAILLTLNLTKTSLGTITKKNLGQKSKDLSVGKSLKYILLNISYKVNDEDMFLLRNNKITFLETLGRLYPRLYQKGFNPQLHKLYPPVQYPHNWVTFLDAMLQMKMLQMEVRLLYVPVGIKTLIVDPIKHLVLIDSITDENCLLPVYVCKKSNTIRSGGTEIRGHFVRTIAKRRVLSEPVLEKYEFVPNNTNLALNHSPRVNIQIVLENNLANKIKVVEIVDDFTKFKSQLLLPLISKKKRWGKSK